MKVFMTGASGWVGSALIPELISRGHEVHGLVRSQSSADKIQALGAVPIHGDLENLDVIGKEAAAADGVIHCGFIPDFSRYAQVVAIDRAVIQKVGDALKDTGKPFIVTSVSFMVEAKPGEYAKETDPTVEGNQGPGLRAANDRLAQSLSEQGVRSIVIRAPAIVHGDGDHGFMPILIKTAKEKGVAGYVNGGTNRWCAAGRFDVARLYAIALEKAAPGTCWHAVADEGVEFKDIAARIGKNLGVEAKEVPLDHFGMMAMAVGRDNPTSSQLTREQSGWTPEEPGLLESLDKNYFK